MPIKLVGALRYGFRLFLFITAYVAATKTALVFAIPPGNATAVWPGAGLAVGGLLLLGWRAWPAVWIASALTNLTTNAPLGVAVSMATGNTSEALLTCYLLTRFLKIDEPFGKVRDTVLFAIVAAGACVIAASVGTASLWAAGLMTREQIAPNWWTWWLGDLASLTVLVPLVLAYRQRGWPSFKVARWLELGSLFICVLAAGQLIFGGWLPERVADNLVYLTMILLAWVSWRFELAEVTACTLLLCGASVYGALRVSGTHGLATLYPSPFEVQIFTNVFALTSLTLASIVAQRREAAAAARTSDSQLRSEITERERAQKWFRKLLDSTPDATLLTRQDGIIVLVNNVAERMFGYPPEALIGESIQVLVPDEHRARHEHHLADYKSAPHIRMMGTGLELSARRRDGQVFPVEISLGPMQSDEGLLVFCSVRDITDRKRAEETLRKQEVQLLAAAEIQKQLLPQASPEVPGFDIAGRCYPADFAAGDYFDYLWLPDGALVLTLADVSGHGVGPALITASFHARFQSLAEVSSDMAQMMRILNARLYHETAGEMFVTAIAGRIDPKSRCLTCVNAGHPPGYVLDASGHVKMQFDSTNMPLAILPEADFAVSSPVQLEDHNLVFLYTDGLTEAHRSHEPMFGSERVLQVIREHRTKAASEIIEAVYAAVCKQLGANKPHDDITLIVAKVVPRQ